MAEPSKRRRIDPPDLISELPDDVIHRIFWFLSILDIVKTSILSKRWRSTWKTTSNLVFDGNGGSSSFPLIADSVLSQYTRHTSSLSRHTSTPAVKKLHVNDFRYKMAHKPKLDSWLHSSIVRDVEDLRLEPRAPLQSMYILPQIFLFGLSKLVRLQVSFCCFPSTLGATDINWPCLEVLSMSNVKLTDDILKTILRGSPILKSLELGLCVGLKRIIIHSKSIKHVLLSDNLFDLVEIRAPDLLSLHLSGNCYQPEGREHISLEDISSLVEAKLDFQIQLRVRGDNRMPYRLLMELLEQLCNVPTITIADQCLQILSPLEKEGVSPQLKCQNLILHGLVNQRDLLGITYNLRSIQCLEKLVIHLAPLENQPGEDSRKQFDFLCSQRGNFEYLAIHLKRVEIIGFEAKSFESNHLLALIEFLLGSALVLEKLIIKAKLHVRPGQSHPPAIIMQRLLKVATKWLSFRRASNNAKVILDYPPG